MSQLLGSDVDMTMLCVQEINWQSVKKQEGVLGWGATCIPPHLYWEKTRMGLLLLYLLMTLSSKQMALPVSSPVSSGTYIHSFTVIESQVTFEIVFNLQNTNTRL